MLTSIEQEVLDGMLARRPDLEACVTPLLEAHAALVSAYETDGTLYTCGNGGSAADAMHIVGELCKSFERRRPLSPRLIEALEAQPFGPDLVRHLEAGLRACTLGLNLALKTAVENDSPLRDMAFAQELNALVRSGDVLLAISTSGNAPNCRMAMAVAKAIGATAVALTGPSGGAMGDLGDIVIRAPGDSTKVVQEAHATLWHTLCLLVEARFYPEMRT